MPSLDIGRDTQRDSERESERQARRQAERELQLERERERERELEREQMRELQMAQYCGCSKCQVKIYVYLNAFFFKINFKIQRKKFIILMTTKKGLF